MINKKEKENLEKLEVKIGKKLKMLLPHDFGIPTIGYSCDSEGNINGLNFFGAGKEDISFLKDFPRLTHLNLIFNQISDLSPLQSLSHLNILNISHNRISDITPLRSLANITKLELSGNQISDLSPLSTLIHLSYLYLESNHISDLSPLLHLKKLKLLDVRYNKISKLYEAWTDQDIEIKWEFDYRDGLFLAGNPLIVPPVEIVKKGNAAIRNYFKELKVGKETVLLLHSKLLLVGSGNVGKTTLMKKLQDNSFEVIEGQEPTTHGINILPWQLPCTFVNRESHPVKIHFWDFGGQDIMYTTHQFFLTKRSLYLFIWEARQEGQETASFDYWLNIIKLLSGGSPVIIVMNKADSRTQNLDEASIRKKFPFIRAFIRISCLKNTGLEQLTELIRSCLADMPHLQDRLPKTWMDIRDALKQLPNPYIPRAEYLAVCQNKGLNEERAEFVSDYLHDLGVILHFRNEPLLAETVILNPEWATAAVYKIMDTKEIVEKKGRFNYDDLKTLWDPLTYPANIHPQLLKLMEKFELCFPVLGTKLHIVPELLPAERPVLDEDKYRDPGSLCYEIHYDFMPRGILSRFITRLYTYILHDHYWKNGVELALEHTFALVQSEPLNRKLAITVSGVDKSELLAIARHHLEEIHRSLNMEKDQHYREMIPCRCDACHTAEKPHRYPHHLLKRCEEKGIPSVLCEVSLEQISVPVLLKGFAPPPPKTDLKELTPELIKTATRLQGRVKAIKTDEDSRNTFIAEILSARGFIVKDQTRWGVSATGKRMGELDILVETPDGQAVSIIEAFNLTGLRREVIADHVRRIFNYDAAGLESNYILVYVENNDFGKLWEEYVAFLPTVEVKYQFQGDPVEEKAPVAEMRIARTLHKRQNRDTAVVHIFINMGVR